ncbi:uncharacterized protein JN550_005418 [Neoarthrinium moseri]|uniref:uncharacterized protein n=1 Tax=Neoarthrinium moseri TaxID=1658444 RepID=UPI001FDD7BF1|nr:uncharacterized protein JN550_005418 [Neoarthrinium moseri]KAI1869828.1 hypothetical protein JN550_005418 [Neoarthrinium moseri]
MSDSSSQRPTTVKRSRKFARSRNGCENCRSLRKKCDKSQPECGNCVARNVPCPGYHKSFKWSEKYQSHEIYKQDRGAPSARRRRSPVPGVTVSQSPARVPEVYQNDLSPLPGQGVFNATHDLIRDATTQSQSAELGMVARIGQEQEGHRVCDTPDNGSSNQLDDADIHEVTRAVSRPIHNAHYRQSRALLQRYYGISPLIPPQLFSHEGSVLVEHYFKDVCGLYSTFDSTLNPFRSSVARTWSNSAPVYYAIQSMAAAHLSNTYATMESIGLDMKRKADAALQEELRLVHTGRKNTDCALMVTLLLGLSACWHSAGDLGLSYLRLARLLVQPRLMCTEFKTAEAERQDQFFVESLIYWEMMTAFVTPPTDGDCQRTTGVVEDESNAPPLAGAADHRSATQSILPHPWTGVGSRVQILFAEVARLVRAERTAAGVDFFWLGDDTQNSRRRRRVAFKLEEELLSLEHPQVTRLIDPGDQKTRKEDFITVAEATRCAALLELYQVFPAILRKRLSLKSTVPTVPEMDRDCAWSNVSSTTKNEGTAFLTSLAIHTLKLVAQLDDDSGTRFLQLMVIVVAATKLRFVSSAMNLDYLDLSPSDDNLDSDTIISSRRFAEGRLRSHLSRLPAKPVRRILELVSEVWRRLDLGEDVFWLDVMIAHRWETIMG